MLMFCFCERDCISIWGAGLNLDGKTTKEDMGLLQAGYRTEENPLIAAEMQHCKTEGVSHDRICKSEIKWAADIVGFEEVDFLFFERIPPETWGV